MIAHTLGNPFDSLAGHCAKHDLWFVEDCCDAMGPTYQRPEGRHVWRHRDHQFYPAHHMTMGEGGES